MRVPSRVAPTPVLTTMNLARVHWMVQALVHFTLGIPLAAIAVSSWGVHFSAVLKVIGVYMGLYVFVYFPAYYFYAKAIYRSFGKDLENVNNNIAITTKSAALLVSRLINLPLKSALIIGTIEISAFIIGGLVYISGVIVPELIPNRLIVIIETTFLGFSVAANIGLLNLVILNDLTSTAAGKIIERSPNSLTHQNLIIRKTSMYTKVFFLILLTTLAGETSVMIFFTTYLLSTNAQEVVNTVFYIGLVMIINFVYIFYLARIVSNNFTTPLNRIAEWIQKVINGQLNEQINFITNDEYADVILGSNSMMRKLNNTRNQLTRSLQRLQEDRTLIELEKKKLSTVLFGVGDGVIALNREQKIVLMNRAAEDIVEYKEKEVLGKHIDKVLTMYDENQELITLPRYSPPNENAISSQRSTLSMDNIEIRSSDGDSRYVNLSCSRVPATDELEAAYIITFHDITEEHELEEMKLDFVSMAAHELRTPLTSILGYMSVYLKEYDANMNDMQKMMLGRVYYSAQELTSLVENLLNVSKIERGSMNLNIKKINWVEEVTRLVEAVKFSAEDKNITLIFDRPKSDSIIIDADGTRMGEVLANLVSNAITYTLTGGTVRIAIEETPTDVITHISDTGIGIPQNAISHLFTKFFRVSGTLEQGSKGTGLGLFISKAIVEMHKGKIWVESVEHKGSTFSFSLPKEQSKEGTDGKTSNNS